ncbi:MAG: DNA primase [Planctomycetales bacterium]|nr:DNA primase [Planctomycetales bacterium]
MTGGYAGDFKEQVRSQTDLVSLVGETVSLTARGGRGDHVALCPFHDDHNPSLHVYADRQTYRCWVCDAGGDCFSWVMHFENVGFREALEQLAERANLEIPRQRRPSGAGRDEKSRLYEILGWAEEQFHSFLVDAPEANRARDYLEQRRLGAETVSVFRIGFHPPVWDWLQKRAEGRYRASELESAGLVRQRQDGSGLRDDFVDRVLFPIHDLGGRTVGFGGRILPDHSYPDAPKYLNSPENPVFSKKSLLYGLGLSRDGIRRQKAAVVVEGYTDCVTAHQYGVDNVVGTLGTALTDEHVTALKRMSQRVVLVYDGDQAGQMAAERALPRFLAQDVDLRVLTLPEGLDPAEFLERHGETAFRELSEAAPEALDFKWQAAVARIGTATVDSRQRLLSEMLELIVSAPKLGNTPREAVILGMVSQRLGVAESELRTALQQRRTESQNQQRERAQVTGGESGRVSTRFDGGDSGTAGRSSGSREAAKQPMSAMGDRKDSTRVDRAERELVAILVSSPESIGRIREQVRAEEIRDTFLRQLLEVCYQIHDNGDLPTFERVASTLEDPELKRALVKIDEEARMKQTSERMSDSEIDLVEETVQVLKWRRERENFEAERGSRSADEQADGGLHDDDKTRLRRAFEHHQKRTRQGVIR